MSEPIAGLPVASAHAMPAQATAAAPMPLPARRAASLPRRVSVALRNAGPLLQYRMNRIGHAGLAGFAMILFVLVLLFSVILPQQRQLTSLTQQIQSAGHAPGGVESAPLRLNHFMDSLPSRDQLPGIIGRVFTLAGTAGVTLERGRYELIALRGGHLAQFRMAFPVKGNYPDIRKLIDSVLVAVPSATLDGLRIERKGVAENTVSADLRFVVVVRDAA